LAFLSIRIEETDVETSIHWVKTSLKRLMKGERVFESDHDKFDSVQFTPENLDLYTMAKVSTCIGNFCVKKRF
jgi:hypothetical protein